MRRLFTFNHVGITIIVFYLFTLLFTWVQNYYTQFQVHPSGAYGIYAVTWVLYGFLILFRGGFNLPIWFYIVLGLLFFCSLINISMAIDRTSGIIRWGLWFGMLMSLASLAIRLNSDDVHRLLFHACMCCIIFSLVSWIVNYNDFGRSTKMNQAIGLYSGLGAVLAFSLRNPSWRYTVLAFMSISIFGTASKGALLSTLLSLLPLIIKLHRWRALVIIASGLTLFALALLGMLDGLIDRFLYNKVIKFGSVLSVQEIFEYSANQRIDLFLAGLELVRDRFWGYGLGDDYRHYMVYAVGGDVHVHNGFLAAFIEAGVLVGGTLCLTFVWMLCRCLYSENENRCELKWLLVSIMVYVLLRNLTENYFLFSFFNIMTIVLMLVILVCMFNFSRQRIHLFYRR